MEEILNTEAVSESIEQQPTEVQNQEPQEIEVAENIEPLKHDWSKDKRYEKMWKKDPNNLFKSYRELETLKSKEYDPLKKKYSELETKIKEFENPENANNKIINYLNTLLDDQEMVDKYLEMLQQLEKVKHQKKYGELPDHVIESLKKAEAMESKMSEFEKKEQARIQSEKDREIVSQLSSVIDKQIVDINNFCKSRNIEFDKETEENLVKLCMESNVPPQLMADKFKSIAFDQLEKTFQSKGQQVALNNLRNSQKRGIVTGTKQVQHVPGKASFGESADKLLAKHFKE